MFKSVRIKNFRGIKDLTVDGLKHINIFVGDNAVGKTAVLDAVYILINPGNPQLPLRTNDWRNLGFYTSSYWKSLFYNFDTKNEIELSSEGDNKRQVQIKPRMSASKTVSPASEISNGGNIKAGSEIEKLLNGLNISFQIAGEKYETSIEQTAPDVANLDLNNSYKETLQGHYLNNKTYAGELDLAEKFDGVNQEFGKEVVIEFLKTFNAGIEDIELDRYKKLLVKDGLFGNKRVPLNTYGDGIVRGLHILLPVISKQSNIVLIDEIENGLHWSKQELVWKFILSIVKTGHQQLFITTHSKEMLEHLQKIAVKENCQDLIKVFRLQNVDNAIKLVTYDEKQLDYAISHGEEFR